MDVFFALSAFVLCRSNYFGRRTFAEFTIGRLARLYPLHALTAIAVLAMGPARHVAVTAAEITQQFTLTHNIGLPPNHLALNFPAWSISVEFWIGLLFYGVLISRRRRWPWLLLTAAALPIVFADITRGDAENAVGVVNLGMLRASAAFSVGALAYLVHEKLGARFAAPRFVSYSIVAALAFLMTRPTWPVSAMLAFYGALFALLVCLPSNDRATVFRSRPLVWLGTVSYSVYLLHMPVLFALQLAFGDRVFAGAGKALVIAAVLIGAHFSHRWIELPCQRRIRGVIASRAASAFRPASFA